MRILVNQSERSLMGVMDVAITFEGSREQARAFQTPNITGDNDNDSNESKFVLGGVEINIVIDSGSKYNIVDRQTW